MSFEVSALPGLPVYGEPATAFSASGRGTYSEGFVVEFRLHDNTPWVGNFLRGATDFDLAGAHPNGVDALIIAGGQGFVIDPAQRQLRGTFGGTIVAAFSHPSCSAIVLNHQNISFEAIGAAGRMWVSRRISWDGLRCIESKGAVVTGEAWRFDDTWHPFRLDLNSGEVLGGSYDDGHLNTQPRGP
jgi:hypothetical protein